MTNNTSEYNLLVQQVATCTRCGLSRTRTRTVPGEGSLAARVMFIGEGPGFFEDQSGRPFVGPAGQLLSELLASVGMKREDVYITNMVKCRPPNNRDPLPGEIQACQPYLDKQLEMIRPGVVVTLGRYSFSKFFPGESISKSRGKPRQWNGIIIYPIYHPAAALHNPKLRSALEEDFKRLPDLIASVGQPPAQDQAGQSKQLSLF